MRITTTDNIVSFAEDDHVILRLEFDDGPAEVSAGDVVDDCSPDELIVDACAFVGRALRAQRRGRSAGR